MNERDMRCVGGDDTDGGVRVGDWDTITTRWLRIICLFERFVSDTDFHLFFFFPLSLLISFHFIAHTVSSHYVRVPKLNDVAGIVRWQFFVKNAFGNDILHWWPTHPHWAIMCRNCSTKWNTKSKHFMLLLNFLFLSSPCAVFSFLLLLDVVSLFYFRITAILARMSIVRRLHIGSVEQHQRHKQQQQQWQNNGRERHQRARATYVWRVKNAHGNYDRHFSLLSLFCTSFLFTPT